jgi:hypothetical protein
MEKICIVEGHFSEKKFGWRDLSLKFYFKFLSVLPLSRLSRLQTCP